MSYEVLGWQYDSNEYSPDTKHGLQELLNLRKEHLVQEEAIDVLMKSLAQLNLHRTSLTIELMTECKLSVEKSLSNKLDGGGWKHDMTEPDMLSRGTFAGSAYEWLLRHLHNPYPSNTLKRLLARNFDVDVKSVNVWFANSRRRMGWTAISKRFFGGCRADTVDYAYRVFERKDSDMPFDEVLSGEFFSMKAKAESLYKGRLVECLSSDSEAPHILPNCIDSNTLLDNGSSERSTGLKSHHVAEKSHIADVTNGIGCLSSAFLQHTGKRLRQDISLSDTLSSQYESDFIKQSRKRFRTPSSSSTQSTSSRSSTHMPSTPKDNSPVEFAFEDWQKGIKDENKRIDESASPLPIPIFRPKKRRLSQSDELPSFSKRPRGMPLPRLHTVSDSYVQNRALFDVEPCASHINLAPSKSATINDRSPDNTEISLFQDWANLSSLVSPSHETQLIDAQVTKTDTPVLVSATSSSLQKDDQSHYPSDLASTLDLPNFADLNKFLEALAADPSLLPPLLPDGLDEVSLFDSNFLTSLGGLEFPPLAALDVPLSTTLVESESDPVSKLSDSDVSSVSLTAPSLPTSQEEADLEKSTESTSDSISSDVVEDKLEMTTIVDGPSSLLDLLCPVSPVETKASVEVNTVIEPIPKYENTNNSASDTREDKLQKLQMLMAEVERLKQEISC